MFCVVDGHGLVEVRYLVAGSAYQRTFAPYLQTRPIAEGDSVRVYYSPRDPRDAYIFPPVEILAEELPAWLAGSLLMSVGMVAAVLVLVSPNPMLRRLSGLLTSPRLISAGITIGVAGGFLSSFILGALNFAKLVAASLVLCGCVIFLRLAWRRRLSWTDLFRSMEFWIAFALAISGNILDAVLRVTILVCPALISQGADYASAPTPVPRTRIPVPTLIFACAMRASSPGTSCRMPGTSRRSRYQPTRATAALSTSGARAECWPASPR